MNKAPRITKTGYPAVPACERCDATFVGPQAADSMRVMFPTRNPKRCRSLYVCPSCADRI